MGVFDEGLGLEAEFGRVECGSAGHERGGGGDGGKGELSWEFSVEGKGVAPKGVAADELPCSWECLDEEGPDPVHEKTDSIHSIAFNLMPRKTLTQNFSLAPVPRLFLFLPPINLVGPCSIKGREQ